MNPVHTFPPYFSNIHLRLGLPSGFFRFSNKLHETEYSLTSSQLLI